MQIATISAKQATPSAGAAAWSPLRNNDGGRVLQRKCTCGGNAGLDGEWEKRREKRLQRKAIGSEGDSQLSTLNSQPSAVPPIVYEVLHSPGRPLDAEARTFFEPRFGYDFSHVRVHTDTKATESARAVNALAYTVGRDVVFNAGQYAPSSSIGRELIAHELAHVLQQDSASIGDLSLAPTNSPHEEAATRAASNVVVGLSGGVRRLAAATTPGQQLHRQIIPVAGSPAGVGLAGPYYAGTFPIPPVPGSRADVRSQAMKIGEQWGDLLGNYEVALETLQTKHAGVSLWDRMTPAKKSDWAKKVQDAFAKLPMLPRVDKPDLAAAQDEGFKAGMESGYSMVRFEAFLIKLGTEVAIALFAGLAARGVRLPRLIAETLRQAERNALIGELGAAGIKFTEEKIVQIARSAAGRIVFLEEGTAESGLQHIMLGHGEDFARIGVSGESNVADLIMSTLKTQTPVRTLAGGEQVFKVVTNGVERGLRIVVSSNGYVVTAFPVPL